MSKLNDKNIVVHANALGRIMDKKMTFIQQRFFVIYLSKLNAFDSTTRCVTFTLDDYAKLMGLTRYNITKLKQCASDLLDTKVCVDLPSGGFTMLSVFNEFTLDKIDDIWTVTIDCSDKLLPFLFDVKSEFMQYALWNMLMLTERNHQQMYRLLKQYERIRALKITLTDLKQCLGLDGKYPEYNPFRVRVIDSCRKALAEKTDIYFEYEPIRKGRKIHAIKFTIHKNTPPGGKPLLSEFVAEMAQEGAISLAQKEASFSLGDGFQLSAGGQHPAYSNSDIQFFSAACNNEFSEAEMNVLIDALFRKVRKKSGIYDAIEFDRFHVLQTAYLQMSARPNVYSRFQYLVAIIQRTEEATT